MWNERWTTAAAARGSTSGKARHQQQCDFLSLLISFNLRQHPRVQPALLLNLVWTTHTQTNQYRNFLHHVWDCSWSSSRGVCFWIPEFFFYSFTWSRQYWNPVCPVVKTKISIPVTKKRNVKIGEKIIPMDFMLVLFPIRMDRPISWNGNVVRIRNIKVLVFIIKTPLLIPSSIRLNPL